MPARRWLSGSVIAGVVGLVPLVASTSASAATVSITVTAGHAAIDMPGTRIFVTGRENGGVRAASHVPCATAALIDAINAANAHGGGTLDLAPACTYTLTAVDNEDENGSSNGLPMITSPVTVHGSGATIARADDAPDPFRLFDVPSDAGRLTLDDLTLTGGIDDTQQPNGGPGNAVLVHDGGSLVADTATFTANGLPEVGSGRGAVGNDHGSVTLIDSTVDHNTGILGGGVYNAHGVMRLVRTTFQDNDAAGITGNGGAVFNDEGGSLVMVDGTVTGNHAGIFGGGLYNAGAMSVVDSKVTDGDVGFEGAPFNVPGEGGGIANFGRMTVTDTSVSGNHSSLDIDGAQGTVAGVKNFRDAVITLLDSPVTDNVAVAAPGGIGNDHGTVRLRNSPVTGNKPTNCAGSVTPVPGCVG